MTSKQRLLVAINREVPDRLPVTTHHVMPFFLDKHLDGASNEDFFARFGLDPIDWVVAHTCNEVKGEFQRRREGDDGFLAASIVESDSWRVAFEDIPDPAYISQRVSFITPKKTLSMVLQSNEYTTWVAEYLIKDRSDIDIIGEYVTAPLCDVAVVNEAADRAGDSALIRGHICTFDAFGQPGTWQDACCLAGTEAMIMATYDDPAWVHQFLGILNDRNKTFVKSLAGARYDILELGGGDASTTVISPSIFESFVAPNDTALIALAHEAGQKIVYHTCGGMMPILEMIADMNPDAMETFTPSGMGGDVDLVEAKRRIGDRVCMIGGFDQFHWLSGCTPDETRQAVRQCFEAAGEGGGYILAPSDHFFDADIPLLEAFGDEARRCVYG